MLEALHCDGGVTEFAPVDSRFCGNDGLPGISPVKGKHKCRCCR